MKKILKYTLGDIKHWIGWALTTGALVGVFYLLPTTVMQSIWQIVGITFGVIVIVDVIKHFIGLQ